MGGKDGSKMIGFEDALRSVTSALEELESGKRSNVAIIGEPYAGKTTLLEEVRKSMSRDITVLRLDSIVRDAAVLEPLEDPAPIVMADDCQYLYLRTIGGFWPLERFLAAPIRKPALFITAWNCYSWDYLNATFHLEHYFPNVVRLPEFTADIIERMIMGRYEDGEIRFPEDAEMAGRSPLDGKYFERYFKKSPIESFRKKIFNKIYSLSGGNPGIAWALWKKALSQNAIRSGDVNIGGGTIDLDFHESYVLSIILSMKRISIDELRLVWDKGGREIDEAIYRLISSGLIIKEGDKYGIRPETLDSIVRYLKKQRLIW
jgi:hypothetical protein